MSNFSFATYAHLLAEGLAKLNWTDVAALRDVLCSTYQQDNPVYVFGNGGSAAISEHFTCDHLKGINEDCTNIGATGKARVHSLSSNIPLITAIANDIGYEQIFSKQIQWLHIEQAALFIAISSSGNSENIIRGLDEAHQLGYNTVAIVGFDGGKVLKHKLADAIVHIPSNNYGVVEDITQMIMHSIAQSIRTEYAKPDKKIKL